MTAHPRTTDSARWDLAFAYAGRQRCDAAASCEFADWTVEGVQDGTITPAARLETVFATWAEQAAR